MLVKQNPFPVGYWNSINIFLVEIEPQTLILNLITDIFPALPLHQPYRIKIISPSCMARWRYNS
jgi:hypothetical protein